MEFVLRTMKPADSSLLKDFLALAIQLPDEDDPQRKEEAISRYLADWGQPGDIGFIIELKKEKKPIGAAWFRQFPKDRPGFAFLGENIPEVSVVILPEYRGLGLGRDLLMKLINQAKLEGFPALSLHVNKQDPALSLYERLQFEVVQEHPRTRVLRRVL